ncbi:MAG TPA: vWA domain-containing protein [Pseudonocardiaceae bacterium]|nr:vWA domain-containing protein [Pseudonocardiaceae bacterium]
MDSSSWVRRSFDGAGLTQAPPGPHLAKWQAKYDIHVGTVLLCIDISASMDGNRLRLAKSGGAQFLREAAAGRYDSGLVLWDSRVVTYVQPEPSGNSALAALRNAGSGGGTDIVPCLQLANDVFGPMAGDRVLCLFSDGEFGNLDQARALARKLCAMGVRIIVRGLGAGAAGALGELACPGSTDDQQTIVDETAIGTGIASMAGNLTGITIRARDGDR